MTHPNVDEKAPVDDSSHWHTGITVGGRKVIVLGAPNHSQALEGLTKAEQIVAVLVSQGLSNRQIAAIRERSPRTIANQLRSIYTKLEIESRQQLVRLLNGLSAE